jgi:hypothetical protein
MRILIGVGIGVFAVLAYQDPAIVDPAMQYAKEIINQIASFLVDKTQ